jgi:probable addiction module antidote protein
MKVKISRFDIAQHLESDDDIAEFLAETACEGSVEDFIHALGIAARARGMTEIAKNAGVTRASLYKSLSEDGRPEFSTVAKVCAALGVRLTVAARQAA